MKTIEELEAELETATRERDLALFAWESAGMTGRDAQSAMIELARQLDAARAEIAAITAALDERDLEAERGLEQYDRLVRERDAAHDSALMFERDWKDACRERDEARAEVERLRGVHPSSLTDVVTALEDDRDELLVRVANQDAELRVTREAYIDAKWTNAYRRGAEAMRETCANAMHPIMRSMISRTEAAQTIRALPIPEEP